MRTLIILFSALFLLGFVEDPTIRMEGAVGESQRSLLGSFWPSAPVSRSMVLAWLFHGEPEKLHAVVVEAREKPRIPEEAFDVEVCDDESDRVASLRPEGCGQGRAMPFRAEGYDTRTVVRYSTGAHVSRAVVVGPMVGWIRDSGGFEGHRLGLRFGGGFTKAKFPLGLILPGTVAVERVDRRTTRAYALVEVASPWVLAVPSLGIGFGPVHGLEGDRRTRVRATASLHWAVLGFRWTRDPGGSTFAIELGI